MSAREEWLMREDNINDGVASEYEMPRVPTFYPDESKLPKTNLNIPMPTEKQPLGSGDRVCDTCVKGDVCMLCSDLHKAMNDIKDISGRTGVFIDTTVKCQKWAGKVVNPRGLDITFQKGE